MKLLHNFGDSDVLKQGETVIAIGNPLGLDFYGSVTIGVISGKDRSVPVDLNGDGIEDWQQKYYKQMQRLILVTQVVH